MARRTSLRQTQGYYQKLIQICLDKGLIPQFWLQQFTALRSTLESGAPTGRNKLGAHGRGASVIEVPSHLTAYALHMAADASRFNSATSR